MKASRDRILTSHAGSLPRPDELVAANAARESAGASDERAFQDLLQEAVAGVVRRQKEVGVDIPGDGEFGKSMVQRVNYRAWLTYAFNRLSGLEMVDKPVPPRPSGPHVEIEGGNHADIRHIELRSAGVDRHGGAGSRTGR